MRNELSMEMSDSSAESCMKNLFDAYHGFSWRHGLSWVSESNLKLCVYHLISDIKPPRLRSRSEADLEHSQTNLKMYFKGYMKHAMGVLAAFRKVDNGRTK